jgi:hypothetical protein
LTLDLEDALPLEFPEGAMQSAAVRLIPQGTAEIALQELVPHPLEGRLDVVQKLSSVKPLALGRGHRHRGSRLFPGPGRAARGDQSGFLLPSGIEGFHLGPVTRLEHLHAGAKLVVELPPEPLILGLIHAEPSSGCPIKEGSAGRGRTQGLLVMNQMALPLGHPGGITALPGQRRALLLGRYT